MVSRSDRLPTCTRRAIQCGIEAGAGAVAPHASSIPSSLIAHSLVTETRVPPSLHLQVDSHPLGPLPWPVLPFAHMHPTERTSTVMVLADARLSQCCQEGSSVGVGWLDEVRQLHTDNALSISVSVSPPSCCLRPCSKPLSSCSTKLPFSS